MWNSPRGHCRFQGMASHPSQKLRGGPPTSIWKILQQACDALQSTSPWQPQPHPLHPPSRHCPLVSCSPPCPCHVCALEQARLDVVHHRLHPRRLWPFWPYPGFLLGLRLFFGCCLSLPFRPTLGFCLRLAPGYPSWLLPIFGFSPISWSLLQPKLHSTQNLGKKSNGAFGVYRLYSWGL